MKRLSLFVLYMAVFSFMVFSSLSLAQTSTNASISGVVRNFSDAIVPGVQLSVRNVDSAVVRTTTTK
jgi:hypothetical protein